MANKEEAASSSSTFTRHTFSVIIFVSMTSSVGAETTPLLCAFSPLSTTHHYHRASANVDALYEDVRNLTGGSGSRASVTSHVDRSICERKARHGSDNVMSTCPWHYEEEVRGDRWPARIVRAVLTCSAHGGGCLRPSPRWDSSTVVASSQRCRAIYRHVSVIRCFADSHGRPGQRREIVAVPVAFTCVW